MSAAISRTDLTHLSAAVAESIQRVLASVRSYLNMDVAFVSEFLGPERVFRNVDSARPNAPIKAGGVIPMAEGYCKHVVDGRLPELIPNTALVQLARTIPETTSIPIGAHLSVPIRLREGRVFGTFCCFSYLPNPQLDRRDLELMKTFAQLVARQIDAEIAQDEERNRKVALIREAVGRGDPRILFQPICRLSDGKVRGVEALSRFSSEPSRSPDLWFKDAAEAGLAESLELIAIRKAIAAASVLPPDVSLSLNVSPAVAIGGRLAEAIETFDPMRTIVEVTEHDMIPDYQALIDALAPIRDRGVRIAIDDAGAGYSSLRHVLMLRPDIIKFDISITRGVDSDPMRRALAAALAEFARHTGTTIVAEGIETPAELEVLRSLGVEKGQGYLFGKPMEPEHIRGHAAADRAA